MEDLCLSFSEMSAESHSVWEKGEQSLIYPIMYIEIKSKKYFIFNLLPCYLLNYMCMENSETSIALLSVFFALFLETNISWVFPLLFSQYRKIINVILTRVFGIPFSLYGLPQQGGWDFSEEGTSTGGSRLQQMQMPIS